MHSTSTFIYVVLDGATPPDWIIENLYLPRSSKVTGRIMRDPSENRANGGALTTVIVASPQWTDHDFPTISVLSSCGIVIVLSSPRLSLKFLLPLICYHY